VTSAGLVFAATMRMMGSKLIVLAQMVTRRYRAIGGTRCRADSLLMPSIATLLGRWYGGRKFVSPLPHQPPRRRSVPETATQGGNDGSAAPAPPIPATTEAARMPGIEARPATRGQCARVLITGMSGVGKSCCCRSWLGVALSHRRPDYGDYHENRRR